MGAAKAFLVCEHLMEATNLPTFLKFGNTKKLDICFISAKNMGGHETEGLGAKLEGACASPLKPPLPHTFMQMAKCQLK